MARLIDLLLTTDPPRRLRLAQSALATLLMTGSVLMMHFAALSGLSDGRWLWTWTAVSLFGLFGAFLLIRCGWSLRLADPSMTMAQMLYAIVCAAWGYAIAGAAHGAVPLILAVVLMFGMFGLTNRQMALVAVCSLLVFGATMAWKAYEDALHFPPAAQAAFFWMTAIMVGGVLVLNARLAGMRRGLREQRRELQLALERIRELATHDDLTGLVNRRHLRELLERDRLRSLRGGHPWSVALIDLDHFKCINDEHGHAAGDEVLRMVARVGQAQCRKGDVLARWGGEEFVVLLQDVEHETARRAVDRLRDCIAAQPLPFGDAGLHVTLSAGVATHRAGEPVDSTLARADEAMYRAKAAGRNRVMMAE